MKSPLASVRQRLELTQAQLAMLSGVSPGAVQFAESGATAIPQRIVETLKGLGVDTEQLQQQHEKFVACRVELLHERAARSWVNQQEMSAA